MMRTEILQENTSSIDGIILFAKRSGCTSFSSLYTIKHALGTNKVGHTGTLDSFACGLLVVCTGRLTKLVSRITELSKEYEAVINFGSQTDTLDYTGTVIKETRLPSKQELRSSLDKFTGELMQIPPEFSAIHINGKRASDLAREGKSVALSPRKIIVYERELLEIEETSSGIKYARIRFLVSKGTYIRSLARDIAESCRSCGYLVGLKRTRVGNFCLTDAAGIDFIPEFSISSALHEMQRLKSSPMNSDRSTDRQIEQLQRQVRKKIMPLTRDIAGKCGLVPISVFPQYENDFFNGKPLLQKMFTAKLDFLSEKLYAVFSEGNRFLGVVKAGQPLSYGFVIH